MPKLPAGLSGKDWQDQARVAVRQVVSGIIGRSVEVLLVHNATGRGPNAVVTYTAKLDSVSTAQEVRRLFGGFFSGGTDSRPTNLKKISISNVVTKETRVRIAILKLFGKKYHDSNPGSRVQVIGYQSRPLLRLIPPQGASDRRPRTYNFIEAVSKLSKTLLDSDLATIATKASPNFSGRLRELFIVLSDDMVSRPTRVPKRGHDGSADGEPPSQRPASIESE
jgi:hypothetical protein